MTDQPDLCPRCGWKAAPNPPKRIVGRKAYVCVDPCHAPSDDIPSVAEEVEMVEAELRADGFIPTETDDYPDGIPTQYEQGSGYTTEAAGLNLLPKSLTRLVDKLYARIAELEDEVQTLTDLGDDMSDAIKSDSGIHAALWRWANR